MSTPELMFRENRCVDCEECVSACPTEALSIKSGKKLIIDRKSCNLCGKCVQKCPTDALSMVGKETGVDEVMKEVEKDSAFYEESKGGVTISGGEPLHQIDFLNAILDECKKKNVPTAVDTSGYASYEDIENIKENVDLFLYDIKMMDEKKHRQYTGVSNKQILENFKRLAEDGRDLFVRFPVVPGINDGQSNVSKTADFILSCGVKRIWLLPYHRAGIEKYRSLGRDYRLKLMKSPTEQRLNLIKEQLEGLGLSVKVGG